MPAANDPAPPVLLASPAAMRAWSAQRAREATSIAFVPTMGALHDGHAALIRRAQQLGDAVVVSIFVNPLQFDRTDDFDRYPRPIDDDVVRCASLGVDAVYAPTAATMYPAGFQTTVAVGSLALLMEGASRPGHFDGVTTVVAKLLDAVRPAVAVFGEKDYQQLVIVRRMVLDLDMGVEIDGHPVVREPDGLAMSSRNLRLDLAQRQAATVIPRALDAALAVARIEPLDLDAVLGAARAAVAGEPLARLDYVTVFDAEDLSPVGGLNSDDRRPGRYRIACAVDIGGIRLIDNRDLFEP